MARNMFYAMDAFATSLALKIKHHRTLTVYPNVKQTKPIVYICALYRIIRVIV